MTDHPEQKPQTRREARARERSHNTGIDVPPQPATPSKTYKTGANADVTTSPDEPKNTQPSAPATPPSPSQSMTRRQLRALRDAEKTQNSEPAPQHHDTLNPIEPIVDKTSGRVIEVESKTAEVIHLEPPEWEPLQKTQTSDTEHTAHELLSSGKGNSATTTNALILPSIPQPDASQPVNRTGEILITGSINLPAELGATGQHPHLFDSADIDKTIDHDESRAPRSGAVPIRASSAVSSRSSTRGIVMTPHAKESQLPLILMVIAATLAVGVGAVLVIGFVFGAF